MSMHSYSMAPHATIKVGWDPPLTTFFVQVHDKRVSDPDDNPVTWLGTSPQEIYDLDDLQRALLRHDLPLPPTSIGHELYLDRDLGR